MPRRRSIAPALADGNATGQLSTYQLLIEVPRPVRLQVGALGWRGVPAGLYVYTGSAKRGLPARLGRHLRRVKRLHWHVDYLLCRHGVRVIAVRVSALAECSANLLVPGAVEIPGFGASDCRAGCGSHLKRVERDDLGDGWGPPALDEIARRL